MGNPGTFKQGYVAEDLSFDSLIEHKKSSFKLVDTKVGFGKSKIGQTKIGGKPDLPKDSKWPTWNGKPLSFLAQINLAEIKALKVYNHLPKEGTLYFFYESSPESLGNGIEERESWRVIYSKEATRELEQREFPRDLVYENRFGESLMRIEESDSFPPWDSTLVERANLSDAELDTYIALCYEISGDMEVSKLLGFPDQIQGEMEEECDMMESGLKTELNSVNPDWVLLFQLDSVESSNMMWGDVGRLYFWIKKEDLMNQNFDDVLMIMQCY